VISYGNPLLRRRTVPINPQPLFSDIKSIKESKKEVLFQAGAGIAGLLEKQGG